MHSKQFSLDGVTIGNATPIFENISLGIDNHSFVGILGKNGSGKTTLLKTLAGLIPPISGTVIRPGLIGWKSNSLPGYCPFIAKTILNMHPKTMSKQLKGTQDELIYTFDLAHLLDHTMEKLSSGEQHRILTARLFCARYDALIIDEPFTALDPKQQATLTGMLEQYTSSGGVVIVATHDVQWTSTRCTRIFLLKNNYINEATSQELSCPDFLDLYS